MDRILLNTLIVSLCAHLFFFFPWSSLKSRTVRKSFSDIEISYFEIKPALSEEIKETKIIAKDNTLPRESIQEKTFITEEVRPAEKKEEVVIPKKEEKEISPTLTKEEQMVARDFAALSKEPVFLDYYRAIREKIKIAANRRKPIFFKPGEIYVFFVLDSRGDLKRLKVIDSKSSPNPVLRESALGSVEDSSPFPPFPQGLKREQIAFNIIIAFEVK
jgi:hypothetical protein